MVPYKVRRILAAPDSYNFCLMGSTLFFARVAESQRAVVAHVAKILCLRLFRFLMCVRVRDVLPHTNFGSSENIVAMTIHQ